MSATAIARQILHADIGQLIRGLAAYGGAEIVTRIVRIAAIVVIARQVSPVIMGTAALALSMFELVRVLANAGIGQRIIADDAEQLAATCNTAHRLFWIWCGCVAVIQIGVAALFWLLFDNAEVAAMLAVLAGVYLMMPGGLVQIFLLMREGRLGTTARINATQTLSDHIITLILVLIWPTAWAIVLPKLLTSPIWLILARRARFWRPDPAAGQMPVRHFLGFGAGVLVTELVTVGRGQLDKLVIGAVFGVKVLGIYYFAFNAGLGITTSFVTALSTVLFPYICGVSDYLGRLRRCRQGLWLAVGVFVPVLAAQVGLAHIYVPIIFGPQWASAAPLVSILGLAALPMIFASVATAWLRARQRPAIDALVSSVAAGAALSGLTMGAAFGLTSAAIGYVIGMALVLFPASFWFLRRDPVAAPILKETFA